MTNNINTLSSEEKLLEIFNELENKKKFPNICRIISNVLTGTSLTERDFEFIEGIEAGVFPKDKVLIKEFKNLIDNILPNDSGALCV